MFSHPKTTSQKVSKGRSKQEIESEKLQRSRKALLRKVLDTGTMPTEPSVFFIAHNKVTTRQLVSLVACDACECL